MNRQFDVWLLSLFACACSMQDYDYLGAERNSQSNSGGFTAPDDSASDAGASNAANANQDGTGGASIATGGTPTSGTEDASPIAGGTTAHAGQEETTGSVSTTAGSSSGTSTGGAAGYWTTTGGDTSSSAGSGGSPESSTGGGGDGGTPATGGSSATGNGGSSENAGNSGSENAGSSGSEDAGSSGSENAGGSTGGSASDGGSANGGESGGSEEGGGGSTGGDASTGGSAAGGDTSTGGSATGGSGAIEPVDCSGCAVLNVPFTSKGQLARYYLKFATAVDVNQRATDGSGSLIQTGTMKVRAFAPALGNTSYEMLIQQSASPYAICYSEILTWPEGITSGWVTLEWSLGSCSSDTGIGRLGLDLIAPSASDAPTPTGTTLWLDQIWIEKNGGTIAGPFSFDSSSAVSASVVTEDYQQTDGVLFLRPSVPGPPTAPTESVTPPTGSTIGWFAN